LYIHRQFAKRQQPVQELKKLGSIASNTCDGTGGGDWLTGAKNIPATPVRQSPDTFHNQVIESWSEQPWAEFCMELDQPAFLLPITGFAEL
jgi:hypothetical protein